MNLSTQTSDEPLTCKDGVGRQPLLDVLDAEIDAFNNLIAAQCES